MTRKNITILLTSVLIFCGLVGYNYFIAQKNLADVKSSPLDISLQSFPEKVVAGQSGSFVWSVDSSPDLSASRTTIYWSYSATPSALTQKDSPEAVNYAYHQNDYFQGIFKLPDTFETTINFPKVGTVYARAYAKVGNNHLWTDEKTIEIISNKENVNQ